MTPFRTQRELKRQDSLENSLSWVPKVQGENRISQAKGQSMDSEFL